MKSCVAPMNVIRLTDTVTQKILLAETVKEVQNQIKLLVGKKWNSLSGTSSQQVQQNPAALSALEKFGARYGTSQKIVETLYIRVSVACFRTCFFRFEHGAGG